ncbi:MAG: hypothetical protein ACREO0_01935 [Pseudoxanthomonas sp.]
MIGDVPLLLQLSAAIRGIFGRPAAGGSTFPASGGRALLSSFVVPHNCDFAQIYLRFDATGTAGTNAKGLIYSNGSSVPASKLAETTSQAIPAGGGILSFAISLAGVNAGTTIWAGGVTDSFQAVWRTTSTGDLSRMEGMNYTTPDASWTQSGTSSAGVNVWIEFIPVMPGAIVGNAAMSLTPSGAVVNVGGGIVGSAAMSLATTGTITDLTPPTTENVGNETLYADSLPTSVGRMSGKQYTMPEDGTLKTVMCGFTATSAGTFNIKGLVYSDTADLPVSLLAHGTAVVHVAGGGFFPSPIPDTFVAAGTKFWLFSMTDDNNGLGEHSHNTFGTGTGEESFMVQPGSFSFASPPTTMPAATARYDYDVSIYATYEPAGAAGAIVGSTTLSLAGTAMLAGAGSLAGATAMAITPSLVRGASGLLVGTTALAITPSLVSGANGLLVGSSALSLTTTAVLAGSGALTGTSALSLANSGTMAAPGLMSGTTALSIAPAGTLAGVGGLTGTATVSLAPSATISAQYDIAGTVAFNVTPAGVLAGAGALVGAAALSLTATGQVIGNVDAAGAAALVLTTSGTLAGQGAIAGTANLALSGSAQVAGEGRLVGSVPLQVTNAGTGMANGELPLVGTTSMVLQPLATLGVAGAMVGAVNLQTSGSGTMGLLAGMVGNASLALSASATGNLIGNLDGAAVIAMAMVGELLGRASLAGNAGLTLHCVGEMNTPPLTPLIGLRSDSFEDGEAERPHDEIEPGQRPGSITAIAER